jgi:hypothetical protein
MDQRIIDLWRGPADRSYVGSDNIDICDVEVVREWTQLRGALIENYMHCYRLIKIEWQLQRIINYLPFHVFLDVRGSELAISKKEVI